MSNTTNLVLPHLAVGQAQKHVTVHEALRRLDEVVQLSVASAPAGALGPNGVLRITATWRHANSANTRTPRIRLGGISGAVKCGPADFGGKFHHPAHDPQPQRTQQSGNVWRGDQQHVCNLDRCVADDQR